LHPFVLPTVVNPYVLLGAAIVAELLGTSALNASEGFTRRLPTLVSSSATPSLSTS